MPNSTPADEATATCPKCGAAQSRHKGEAKVSFGQWRHDGDLLPMWECYTWFEDKKPSLQCQLACANQQIDELKGKLGEAKQALEKISKARRVINAMVIDPCPPHMCYASHTADVAKEAISIIERREAK